MDWLDIADFQQQQQKKQNKALVNLLKWKKFTLYDHNYSAEIDQQNQSFYCIFNCKKINKFYSTIGKISGSFKTNQIVISCSLTDYQTILGGKWNYQKIQLTRFAFRYNERSTNNILIKVNPVNGQVTVCMSFIITKSLFEDQLKFKQIITDYCQVLGQESEKIFNTMMEIIFCRQANEPYLKSGGAKVNPSFPRYMKVQKLLDKVKSLIATSNFYKIRLDISAAHKNRSFFKKIFLSKAQHKKQNPNPFILQMALAYELKYNKKYEELQKKMGNTNKNSQYIKQYFQIQEKNETQFAKHLNQGQKQDSFSVQQIFINQMKNYENLSQQSLSSAIKFIQTNNNQFVAYVDNFRDHHSFRHCIQILKRLKFQQQNITKYYVDANRPQYRITEGIKSMPILQFLEKNRKTMSLSTKFDFMAQVCNALYSMHKKNIGCFLRLQDFIIDSGFQVKLRNLEYAYAVSSWREDQTLSLQKDANKVVQSKSQSKVQIQYLKSAVQFPYIKINLQDINDQKCDVYSLGVTLFQIIMGNLPFSVDDLKQDASQWTNQEWKNIWMIQTQYFLTQGGQIVKMVGQLLLKCMNFDGFAFRPYVQWLLVIISQIKTSLNGLY